MYLHCIHHREWANKMGISTIDCSRITLRIRVCDGGMLCETEGCRTNIYLHWADVKQNKRGQNKQQWAAYWLIWDPCQTCYMDCKLPTTADRNCPIRLVHIALDSSILDRSCIHEFPSISVCTDDHVECPKRVSVCVCQVPLAKEKNIP